MKIKIRKNDEVIIIAGAEKGRTGRVLRTNVKNQTVVVKDLNKVTKHVKPSQKDAEGSIKTFEAPIHVSNVAIVTKKASKTNKPEHSRIAYKTNKDGKKVRIAVKTKKEI